ncbi:hypothetical protein NA57DRAFT_73846 [Rhizodiscina lignyota]|uniref:Extracellular serine-rich protein n=1 Tax=Rhizodiscina lignyota TaxID=1504668 RepID=A0A9P4IEB3_9PEZI|nr:hypothetical protein NA57DRAFT_73846 [Rhizodiscina lignyota]
MRLSSVSTSVLLGVSAQTVAAYRNHDVTVGKGGMLVYDPESISAHKGDTVTYHFFAKNHSVTQSSFDDPCHPLPGGFFSAFTPNPSPDTASPTTFQIKVNDTKPIWVYCSQTNGNHCQKGMVHSINAPLVGNTIGAFKNKAAKASISTSPSNDPPGGVPVGGLRKIHIEVGPAGNLTYSPNNITEPPGTVLEFAYNPKNHSVVQSSFADPCHPLAADGFSSGLIPTQVSPSGAIFDVVVNDTKPIWFYCAQTTKDHCQSGMVGSVNAPVVGNTLEKFIGLAKKASTSTIPPEAPIGGIFIANGTVIKSFGGDVFDNNMGMDEGSYSNVPPPGTKMSPYWTSMAGGSEPSNYHWPSTISNEATEFLQLLEFVDNVLLELLMGGYKNLTNGPWDHLYPKSITDTIQSMTAQAMVHRKTYTDSLQHYKKEIINPCRYSWPIQHVNDFVQVTLVVLLLQIGILLDISATVGPSDSWLIPALGVNMGSKARMTGVLNMIQDHTASSAPREVMLPSELVYSYIMDHYVVPGSCPDKLAWETQLPRLVIAATATDIGKRITEITITITVESTKDLHVAWIGPWGGLVYSPLESKGSGHWSASVPSSLYGHVWAVVVTGQDYKLQEISKYSLTSPEVIWVTDVQQMGSKKKA